jgi:hypothetical protein
VNDFGAALTLSLGLTSDDADHLLGQVHLLHFNHAHFDTPRRSVLAKHGLQPDINLSL